MQSSLIKVDEPPLDSENLELLQFAEADCKKIKQPHKAHQIKTILVDTLYVLRTPFWRQRMTVAEIRLFREMILPKPKRKFWNCRLVLYFLVNWLMQKVCAHIKTLNLDMYDGKHAWFIIQAVWVRTFASEGQTFFPFFAELRPRSFEDFLNRDKTFFDSRNGEIFTHEACEALYYVLILSYRGNKFIRLLYSWVYALINCKVIDLDEIMARIPLFKFIVGNAQQRLRQIKHIRREALERIEKYAENMLRYAVDNGEVETAVGWNDVICRVRALKGFRPTNDNRGKLAVRVKELSECFNAAAKRTYVHSLIKHTHKVEVEKSTEDATGEDLAKNMPIGSNAKFKMYGRFKMEIVGEHYRITDTVQWLKPYKIKKSSNAGKAARQLLLNYKTGTDQTHSSSREWVGAFQRGRGDAFRFAKDQIFMLPRWNVEKQKFIVKQGGGYWRLWMDDELSYSKEERVLRFMAAHSHGLPQKMR